MKSLFKKDQTVDEKMIESLMDPKTILRSLSYSEAMHKIRDEMGLAPQEFAMSIAVTAAAARATWPQLYEAAETMADNADQSLN